VRRYERAHDPGGGVVGNRVPETDTRMSGGFEGSATLRTVFDETGERRGAG